MNSLPAQYKREKAGYTLNGYPVSSNHTLLEFIEGKIAIQEILLDEEFAEFKSLYESTPDEGVEYLFLSYLNRVKTYRTRDAFVETTDIEWAELQW